MDYEGKKVFLVNCAFTAVAVLLIYLVVRFMLGYLLPFVIGVALAFLMQRPARFLSSKTHITSGTWAAVLVVATYLLLSAAAGVIVWQTLIQLGGLATRLPQYLQVLGESVNNIAGRLSAMMDGMPEGMEQTVYSVLNGASEQMTAGAASFFSAAAAAIARNLPPFLISTVVTVVASCYIAKDYDRLLRFLKGMISRKTCDTIVRVREILTGSILKFALGYLLLMGITFVELTVGLLLLRVRYAVAAATLIAVIDILPVLGTGTVLLPWCIFEFVAGNAGAAIGLLVLYLVITVARNFLEPRVIGRQMGINPLLTLITMFVGLRLAGFAGMLLLPVSCIVVITYYKRQLEEEKGFSINSDGA